MKSLALVIGGLTLASSVTAVATAQGIGDAARKERSRRAAAPNKEPAKVYVIDGSTSSDKGQSSDQGTSSSKGQTGNAATSQPKLVAFPIGSVAGSASDGPTDSNGRNESYWRGRYASAQRSIDAADRRVKDLEVSVAQYGPIPPGPAVGCYTGDCVSAGQIEAGRRAQRQLEAAKERAAAARKAMDDLQEEGRRAGALPGWLR